MRKFPWIISGYLIRNILPYFIFSWLLLSVILFIQQASRFTDIFFSVNIPRRLIWELSFALVPNVIAFTCPMAILIGVIIGLSKMQGDSELRAIRAAGVGNFQILLPVAVLGLLLSGFAFLINREGVPFASKVVRRVALQTALMKLESPVEPGVFNTEISGYTIYVKGGDLEEGSWKNIFIYQEDRKNNLVRLITSKSGRIDSTINVQERSEFAELVLKNATVTTLPLNFENELLPKIAAESINEIRITIKTKRDDIIKKLTQTQETPEELGLEELARLAKLAEGKEKTEAQILWQRRILLSVTPFIFALLGAAVILRFNRGGRGFGIFLALVILIGYYFVTLIGEQLTRTGKINLLLSGFLPVVLSLLITIWLLTANRFFKKSLWESFKKFSEFNMAWGKSRLRDKNFMPELTTGIRDFDIVYNLLKYFLLTLTFLIVIYLIFTAFELWKFAGESPNGLVLLFRYLFFLVPFVYLQIASSALMIAILATFVIKSRQNEIVIWTAAGQSIYRLIVPCLLLMLVIGFVNWNIQEYIAPKTNQWQDSLRSQIRNRGILSRKEGKFWVANDHRIYAFEAVEKESGENHKVSNLTVYEFSPETNKIVRIFFSPMANWQMKKILLGRTTMLSISGEKITREDLTTIEMDEPENPFNNLNQKPSHLNSAETRNQLTETSSETGYRTLRVALHKKYTTPFLPFLIALFTLPFALSLKRQGKVLMVGYAVAVWLVFLGLTSFFEQAGVNGSLSPLLAVWSPLFLFAILGIYLLTRVRT